MTKTFFLAIASVLFICTGVAAQQAGGIAVYPKANTDSLSIVNKISNDQLKLGKLQNEVEQKTKDKNDASAKAQQSANDNSAAATKLGDNPTDQKLARKANRSAGDAKSDAHTSRKDTERLDKLNKQIGDLKQKIADNQTKLDKFTTASTVTPR